MSRAQASMLKMRRAVKKSETGKTLMPEHQDADTSRAGNAQAPCAGHQSHWPPAILRWVTTSQPGFILRFRAQIAEPKVWSAARAWRERARRAVFDDEQGVRSIAPSRLRLSSARRRSFSQPCAARLRGLLCLLQHRTCRTKQVAPESGSPRLASPGTVLAKGICARPWPTRCQR
jgi:hypothetical protein